MRPPAPPEPRRARPVDIYQHLNTLSLLELIQLVPPPIEYAATNVDDETRELDQTGAITSNTIRSAYSLYRANKYAQQLYTGVTEQWRTHGSDSFADAHLRHLIAQLDAYCCQHRAILNQHVPKGWPVLVTLFVVRCTALCILHRTVEGADDGRDAYERWAGAASAGAFNLLVDAELVMYGPQPIRTYTVQQLHEALHVVAERWRRTQARSDDLMAQLERYLELLEMHAARSVLLQHVWGVELLANDADPTIRAWFAAAESGAVTALPEWVCECASIFTALRQSIDYRRTLIVAHGPQPHALTDAYSAERMQQLVDHEMGEMRDKSTFLRQLHESCTHLAPHFGERERYRRAHAGVDARNPSDLLSEMRTPGEVEFWMEKNVGLNYESMWFETSSDLVREYFLHAMITVQARARVRDFDWRGSFVLYENSALANNMSTAHDTVYGHLDAITSPFAGQPVIVESMGAHFVCHNGRVYETYRLGEAVAVWFLYAVHARLPPEFVPIAEAYRAFLWHSDDDALVRLGNGKGASTAPPGFSAPASLD